LYMPLIPTKWYITRPSQYRSLSSPLCSFLQSPVTSFLLGPNILFSTLFSNTLSLRFFLSVRDQVSHSCKQQQNYSSVYFNLYIFGYESGRQKILHRMIASIPWFQTDLNFFLNTILIC
jgi:hypothetical protein